MISKITEAAFALITLTQAVEVEQYNRYGGYRQPQQKYNTYRGAPPPKYYKTTNYNTRSRRNPAPASYNINRSRSQGRRNSRYNPYMSS